MVTVMSTHFHLVATVPNGDVSDFMHALDSHLARALPVLRRYVVGVVWAPGKLSIVQLHTAEAVAHQIAYAMVNPVASGLGWKPSDWPGLNPSTDELGERPLSERKPDYYFTGKTWAPRTSVKLELPMEWFESEDEARDAIARHLEGAGPGQTEARIAAIEAPGVPAQASGSQAALVCGRPRRRLSRGDLLDGQAPRRSREALPVGPARSRDSSTDLSGLRDAEVRAFRRGERRGARDGRPTGRDLAKRGPSQVTKMIKPGRRLTVPQTFLPATLASVSLIRTTPATSRPRAAR